MSVVVGGIYFKEFDELYGSHIAAVLAGECLLIGCRPVPAAAGDCSISSDHI